MSEPSSSADNHPIDWSPDPDRLEALAEFAAAAGHEINNPLGTIVGRASQLLRDEQDPARRQMLAIIGAQALRVRDMIGDVMLFARPPAAHPQRLHLNEELERWRMTWQADEQRASTPLEVKCEGELVLWADPAQFAVILAELTRNSREALLPDGGPIRIEAVPSDFPDRVRLSVIDRGRGFTDVERCHAFDPFYSGRQAGRGLGFGLCKVWRIAQMHNATIVVTGKAGEETRIVLEWPIRAADSSSPA
ncbi:MAG: HAMP domain-containing histidine kinase [Planctomycetaceae bacterium]|nr:HAMP domain-containing histidine kinase [Planctomycetaceae bacterium]